MICGQNAERQSSLPAKNNHPVSLFLAEKEVLVAEAYTTQPNGKASSRVLYNIFESTCGGVTVITHVWE
jgi:hypothetical protein